MTTLHGKIALITGGNSGIGLATAHELARQGATVIITGRDPDTLTQAVTELGDEHLGLQTDVSDLAALDRLYGQVRERFGHLDVLFVNAGIAELGPVEAVTETVWDNLMNTNVKGAFFTVQKALPLLRGGSTIILNSTTLASLAVPGTSAYSAGKAALSSLGRTLAAELVTRGIRVNTISPGPVGTPLYPRMTEMNETQVQALAGQMQTRVPLGRFGTPDEIAKAVAFLASSDAEFIVGQDLAVDGGFRL
jgi:NAD(P)-dependent dehydrogenase (short-subunit alcohol dehydrogenase family)